MKNDGKNINTSNKIKDVYRGKNLEDLDLIEQPAFNQSIVGEELIGRLGDKTDLDSNVFKIRDQFNFTIVGETPSSGSEVGSYVYTHNLGYRPFVMGTYKVVASDSDDYPVGQRGLIPESRKLAESGLNISVLEIKVEEITESELKISVHTYGTPTITISIAGEVLLFRELVL